MFCPQCRGNGYLNTYTEGQLAESETCWKCNGAGELRFAAMSDEAMKAACGDDVLLWVQAYIEISEAAGVHADERLMTHWFSMVREASQEAARALCAASV